MGFDFVSIPVPDLTQLARIYGRLSGYMHIQKNEMDIVKWNELETLIKEAHVFLYNLVHPQKARVKLTVEGLRLFEEFKAETKASPEIIETIKKNFKKYVSGTKLLLEGS